MENLKKILEEGYKVVLYPIDKTMSEFRMHKNASSYSGAVKHKSFDADIESNCTKGITAIAKAEKENLDKLRKSKQNVEL